MSKNKAIFTKSELHSLLAEKDSCVVLKNSIIDVYLLPYYFNNVEKGLRNALHEKLKTYDSKVEGILLGYDNIEVDLDAGRFSGRNAEIKYPVSCDCYIFQPAVGKMLRGNANQISPDHIGCIVHRYFNATIKRPEDEDYEHWTNRCIDFNDTVSFRVKDLDYTGIIPYIEGELEYTEKKGKEKKNKLSSPIASSEYGVEDVKKSKKLNKKKRESMAEPSPISSTQLITNNDESQLGSGLDFDFLSPIPAANGLVKLHEPTTPAQEKRVKTSLQVEPQDNTTPAQKKKVKTSLQVEPQDPTTPAQEKKVKTSLQVEPQNATTPAQEKKVKTSLPVKEQEPTTPTLEKKGKTPIKISLKKKKSKEEPMSSEDLRQQLLQEQLSWLSDISQPKNTKRKRSKSPSSSKPKKLKMEPELSEISSPRPLESLENQEFKQNGTSDADDVFNVLSTTPENLNSKQGKAKKQLFKKESPSSSSPGVKKKPSAISDIANTNSDSSVSEGKQLAKLSKSTSKNKPKENTPSSNVSPSKIKKEENKLPTENANTNSDSTSSPASNVSKNGKNTKKQSPAGNNKKPKSANKTPPKTEATAIENSVAETPTLPVKSKGKARPSSTKKPRVKQDPVAKKMAYYLQKLQEMVNKGGNSDLLQNMIKSSSLVNQEDIGDT